MVFNEFWFLMNIIVEERVIAKLQSKVETKLRKESLQSKKVML
jgi:hypothetical protein